MKSRGLLAVAPNQRCDNIGTLVGLAGLTFVFFLRMKRTSGFIAVLIGVGTSESFGDLRYFYPRSIRG